MKIPIIATSLLKFGELWDMGINDLIRSIGIKVLNEAALKPQDIEKLYISNVFASKTSGQALLGSIAYEELGIDNSVCINVGDASGAAAILEAANSIISGKNNIVMVLGVEKVTDFKTNELHSLCSELISQEESFIGATVQSQFGIITRKYLHDFKLSANDLYFIPSKNHKHALKNEYAQYMFKLSEDKIKSSPIAADPIRMFDCASYCDGAAALIMCNEKSEKRFKAKGYLLGGSLASDSLSLSKRKSITAIDSAAKASKESFKSAGIKASKIDLLEVHDIVPISEVLAIEDMGFVKKGQGVKFIKQNWQRINLSGGLKACGHAVGATGVRQTVDLINNLKTANNIYGLTHTISGTGGVAAVNIFGVK